MFIGEIQHVFIVHFNAPGPIQREFFRANHSNDRQSLGPHSSGFERIRRAASGEILSKPEERVTLGNQSIVLDAEGSL